MLVLQTGIMPADSGLISAIGAGSINCRMVFLPQAGPLFFSSCFSFAQRSGATTGGW